MEPTPKLILSLALLTILVGFGLFAATSLFKAPEAPPLPPKEEELAAELPPPTPIPLLYLGQELPLSLSTLDEAAWLLHNYAAAKPDHGGINTPDEAKTEIRILLAKTSQGLSNFSAADLACESLVRQETPCTLIQTEYLRNHEGYPNHATLFPPEDGYTCHAIRSAIPTPEAATPYCQELSITGQRRYLCKALQAHDCAPAYSGMIQDYTYTELAISTNNPRVCTLVSDPTIAAGCNAMDSNTVRNDLMRGFMD